ncbi:diphosphomevalonate decarboxylase [candidate division KSB1 bacterium]|nr:diphosphomevalonate decarboxylase [candidate division KSB1 bacterium]
MKKSDLVTSILKNQSAKAAAPAEAEAYASANIALIKYWGKRDQELNLPNTSSLSISLSVFGTRTRVKHTKGSDKIFLNKKKLAASDGFVLRIRRFLDLFRSKNEYYEINTLNTVPTAAGLASSASGFAALVKALNDFYAWGLGPRELSILARLGSGSACRSIEEGFVLWNCGIRKDGMDSFAEKIDIRWPELAIGVIMLSTEKKKISSREGMQRTVETSVLYHSWQQKVEQDLARLKQALENKDIALLGQTAESNALSMHATALAAWPPVCYWQPKSLEMIQRVWALRHQGLGLYLTMDAGANIKLLFKSGIEKVVKNHFPTVECIYPFK